MGFSKPLSLAVKRPFTNLSVNSLHDVYEVNGYSYGHVCLSVCLHLRTAERISIKFGLDMCHWDLP
jgi:hypothetical protein